MTHFKVGGKRPITFDRFIRGVLAVLLIVGFAALLYYLKTVLIPFFIAWAAAYLLYPMVRYLQIKTGNRLIAITLTIIVTFSVLCGFFYLVIPPMINEVTHLKDVALEYLQKGSDNAAIPPAVQEFTQQHAREYNIENFLQQPDVISAIKSAVPTMWEFLWSTAGIIINTAASLIGLLYLLFLLTDYEKYANGWIHFIPKHRRNFAAQLAADVERNMAGYFRGQALVALSNCVMFSIGFVIIDFPMPIGLGCLIGVISFVPYLQVVGFVPAAFLALLKAVETGQNFWWLLCLVLIVYIVVQILQDTIFTPRIMGKIMGLPPAIILLSLSVWGYAFGIIGLIIALPITTLAISYYRRYVLGEQVPVNSPIQPDPEDIDIEKRAGIYIEAPDPAKSHNLNQPTKSNTTHTNHTETKNLQSDSEK